jgi:hypothetical protein
MLTRLLTPYLESLDRAFASAFGRGGLIIQTAAILTHLLCCWGLRPLSPALR